MPRRVSFDPEQVPTREPGSDAEVIRVRGQKQPQIVRTYDPTLREWNYTALGRQFFANKTVEYVVSIPVRIVGNRKDELGEYSRRTQLPVNVLGLEKNGDRRAAQQAGGHQETQGISPGADRVARPGRLRFDCVRIQR